MRGTKRKHMGMGCGLGRVHGQKGHNALDVRDSQTRGNDISHG